jgi:hypothetical protein
VYGAPLVLRTFHVEQLGGSTSIVGAETPIVVVVDVVDVELVVVVLGTKLQHSFAGISTHLPTLGFFLLRIRLLGTILPVPSKRTKALRGRLLLVAIIYIIFLF